MRASVMRRSVGVGLSKDIGGVTPKLVDLQTGSVPIIVFVVHRTWKPWLIGGCERWWWDKIMAILVFRLGDFRLCELARKVWDGGRCRRGIYPLRQRLGPSVTATEL